VSHSRRAVTALVLLVLMAGFGIGVNRYLASRTTSINTPAKNPTTEAPQFTLPGAVYFADNGGLYALNGTSITQLQAQGQGWSDPVALPGGAGLLAVKTTANYYSDLYELSLTGAVQQQLSHDSSSQVTATDQSKDDWIYYPAIGPDNTLYFAYDWPKQGQCDPGNGYEVDMSIWETTLGSTDIDRGNVQGSKGITLQAWANYYTGGDANPVPLAGGGLIYSDYESAYSLLSGASPGDEISQIRMDPKVGPPDNPSDCPRANDGTALTQPQDDCAQPSLNASQTVIAMVCTPVVGGAPSSTEADLVVATFDAQTATIGPLDRIVTGTMVASPVWSPDGQDLLYEAPESGDGYFQLWYLKGAAGDAETAAAAATPSASGTASAGGTPQAAPTSTATPAHSATRTPAPAAAPAAPKQVTMNLDLDGSAPAWVSAGS